MYSYRFADLYISMSCQYGLMKRRSHKYLTETVPAIDIVLEIPETLMTDWIKRYPHLTPAEIELILLSSLFSGQLLRHNGFVLHASAIAFRQCGILFSGDPGVGKSTHSRLWQKHFGEEASPIINDDKPAIRCIDDIFYVYGTPFSGNSDKNLNIKVPLHAICFLAQDASNSIRKLSPSEALPLVMRQTKKPKKDAAAMDALLSLLDHLLTRIPVYLLRCNTEEAVVELAASAMFPHCP